MPTLIKDLRGGTSLYYGPQTFRRSGARRTIFAEGLDGDRGDLFDAIGLALLDPTILIHPDLGLGVDQITVRHTADGEVIGHCLYNVDAVNPNTGFTAIDLSGGDLNYEETKVALNPNLDTADGFDANGRPNGPEYGRVVDGDRWQPESYTAQEPVWNLHVSTVLDYNPAGTIGYYLKEKINSNNLTWDGFSIPQYTLRFEQPSIRNTGDKYYFVDYTFTIRNGPWQKNILYYKKAGAEAVKNPTVWMHPARSFTTPGFPVA